MPTYEQILQNLWQAGYQDQLSGGATPADASAAAFDDATGLNFDLNGIGIGDFAQSGATQTLTSQWQDPQILASTTLSGQEILSVLRFLNGDFLSRYAYRDIRVFATKLGPIFTTAYAAKGLLGGTIGPKSTGTIIPQVIRPVTVYASTGSSVENWLQAAVTAGWQAAFWTYNLNATNAGGIAINPQNRVVAIALGIADEASAPKVFEYQPYDPSGNPLGVHSLPFIHTQDNLDIFEFAEANYIGKNQQMKMDINFETAGQAIPELLGIQYVTAEYATAE